MINFVNLVSDNIISFRNKIVTKEDLILKLLLENISCKKRNQSTLYSFYNYTTMRLEFADTKLQFRQINTLWETQGFSFSKRITSPKDFVNMIGATSIVGHVWRNKDLEMDDARKNLLDPLSILIGGYMNAYNEVITWEITW